MDPERTVSILLTATNENEASNADYSGVPTSVTFNSGETSKTFSFTATDDSEDDDGERVRLGFGTLPSGVSDGGDHGDGSKHCGRRRARIPDRILWCGPVQRYRGW